MILDQAIKLIFGKRVHRGSSKLAEPKPKLKFDLAQHMRLIRRNDMEALPDRRLQLRRSKCKTI